MAKYSLYVVGANDQKVPFLRGMLTHSLIEQGLSFKDAYKTSNLVRDQIKDRGSVSKKKLRNVIRTVLKEEFGDKYESRPESIEPAPRTILVKGQQVAPFSKGILSQSLQASGLEPEVAYEIALGLERSLLEENREAIERDDLRQLIYHTIQQNHDERVAERYLLWRYFKSPDKPVVILFGGATGTGKTSVATEVAHRLGINKVLSTDTIRQMMRMMFSKDLLPAIHTSSFEAWKEIKTEGEGRSAVTSAFREQSVRILVGVRAMLERAIQENTSLIIDGVHLVPGLMRFDDLENRAYIVPVVISTLDRDRYLERFPAREHQSSNRQAKHYRENFDSILQIQDYILEMAENNDIPIVENRILDKTVGSLLTVITNSLREKLKFKSEELLTKAF